MKKTITLILTCIMILLTTVVTYAANLHREVFDNGSGHRVIKISGDASLMVYARGSNIWNATYGWGVNDCKGPDYVDVFQNNGQLVIMYVNNNNVYRRSWASQNYFTDVIVNGTTKKWNGEAPLNTPSSYQQTASNYQNNNGYNNGGYYYDNGYNNGYNNGGYYYDNGYGYNYNYNYYDDYYYDRNRSRYDVYVEKSGKTWKYRDGSETYTYTLKSGQLDYGNYEIADDVDAIGFIEGYLIYIVDDDEIWAVRVGKKDEGEQIGDGFEGIWYDDWNLIDRIKVDGKKYDADDIEDVIKDGDFDDDDDDEDYPYAKKSSNKYTFYKSKSSKYVYTFEDGEVEYKNDEIMDEVDTIGFSKAGYIYILTSDGDLYHQKVGRTDSPTWIDGNIDYMSTDSDYMVTKIVDDDGHSLKAKDYE